MIESIAERRYQRLMGKLSEYPLSDFVSDGNMIVYRDGSLELRLRTEEMADLSVRMRSLMHVSERAATGTDDGLAHDMGYEIRLADGTNINVNVLMEGFPHETFVLSDSEISGLCAASLGCDHPMLKSSDSDPPADRHSLVIGPMYVNAVLDTLQSVPGGGYIDDVSEFGSA